MLKIRFSVPSPILVISCFHNMFPSSRSDFSVITYWAHKERCFLTGGFSVNYLLFFVFSRMLLIITGVLRTTRTLGRNIPLLMPLANSSLICKVCEHTHTPHIEYIFFPYSWNTRPAFALHMPRSSLFPKDVISLHRWRFFAVSFRVWSLQLQSRFWNLKVETRLNLCLLSRSPTLSVPGMNKELQVSACVWCALLNRAWHSTKGPTMHLSAGCTGVAMFHCALELLQSDNKGFSGVAFCFLFILS